MRFYQLILLLATAAASCQAIQKPGDNFRIVLDNKSPRGPAIGFRSNSSMDFDAKALAKKVQAETKEIVDRFTKVMEKIQAEAKDFISNFKHYNKVEIGLYTALALSLTVALRTFVFTKGISKTLDLAVISYILNSPAARAKYASVEPVKELSRRKLKLYVSTTVSSTDNRTYRETVPKVPRKVPSKIPPPPPARPAQVVVDTVSAFYEEHDAPPASHNAVVKTMSPAMRQRLRARRIRGGEVPNTLMGRLTVGFYFITWYALNVFYNIINKKVLNVLPAPLTVGTIQFGIGALYCGLIWLVGLRPCPKLTPAGKRSVAAVGFYHALGQLASMLSLGAGPVSFTHIVKAMEPFFSAIVSGFYFKKWMKAPVYATLIPVVGGVGYACLKELNFSWLAFGAAMASNLAFALRAVQSKIALQSGKETGSNLTPPNMFGLVTWAALLISIPIALIGESNFMDLLSTALESIEDKMQFYRAVFLSGLFHYLNNEVMYLALGSVHPVTLAVGNTMKRVFILVASVMVFRNPVTVQAMIGSGVGIAGVLLYSLTKQYCETLEVEDMKNSKKGQKLGKFIKPAMKVKIPPITKR